MKKWWAVRHLRYFYHRHRCYRHTRWWERRGADMALYKRVDRAMLHRIWEGKG